MDTQDRIVRRLNKLPLADRKEIASRIIEGVLRETGTMDSATRFWMLVPFAEAAMDTRLSTRPFSRRREDVMIRMFVADQMVEEGYTTNQIGHAMMRDHSTVSWMTMNMKKLKAGYYGPQALKQYNDFKKLTI
jgi:hypothetical protein